MKMNLVLGIMAAAGLLGAMGCGSDDPNAREACEQVAAGVCERFYACLPAQVLADGGFPATEAECAAVLAEASECAQVTDANACGNAGTYHADQAGDCVAQVGSLTCPQILDPDFDAVLMEEAPACDKICSIE